MRQLVHLRQPRAHRLTHSGFELPRNETAFTNMRQGWAKVLQNVEAVVAGID